MATSTPAKSPRTNQQVARCVRADTCATPQRPCAARRRAKAEAVRGPARGAERAMRPLPPCVSGRRVAHERPMAARCGRSEEHTSELQSRFDLVCRLLLEKKKKNMT